MIMPCPKKHLIRTGGCAALALETRAGSGSTPQQGAEHLGHRDAQNGRMSEVGEAAGVLTAALIVDGARAVDPVISPDGRWVTWVTSSAGGPGSRVRELWLASVAGTTAPVRLAEGGVRLPCWSADSAWLFYVAGAELRRRRITADGSGGDDETVLCWDGKISGLAPLAGGRLVALIAGDERTDHDKAREAGHDDAIAWSERAGRQHWLWHRLRLLDLASGELSVVAGLAGRHVTAVAQRPHRLPQRGLTHDVHRELPEPLMPRCPQQLGNVRLDPLRPLTERRRCVEPHDLQLNPRIGEPNSRANPSCCPTVDTPRSTPSVPIATRHPPPVAGRTDQVGRDRVGKEHLVELRGSRSAARSAAPSHRPAASAPASTTVPGAGSPPKKSAPARSTSPRTAPATSTPSAR